MPRSDARLLYIATIAGTIASLAPLAGAQTIVFRSDNDNGVFTPFNSANALTVKYGDSGWLGSNIPPQRLRSITLRMCSTNSFFEGSGDMRFTFNEGDPSGLIFGSGQTLLTATVPGVVFPAAAPGDFVFFEVNIPLNGIVTAGGFNNVGWSIGWTNFNYTGQVGFAVSTANAQPSGFYTNNASFFNGSAWSLFAFSQDPITGVANYTVTIEAQDPCNQSDVAGPNQSTIADGALTADDIIVFLGWYFAADTRADIAGENQSPAPDGSFTADDIIVYLGRYFAGC